MVDLEILKRFGCSSKKWRALLEDESRDLAKTHVTEGRQPHIRNPKELDGKEARANLIERIRARTVEGRNYNLNNWRHFATLDAIWDAPRRNITPTLLAMTGKKFEGTEEVMDAVKNAGIDPSGVIADTMAKDTKTDDSISELNVPAFFSVTIPVVKAYGQIRRAKLFNDRNLDPLFKVQAIGNTEEDRIRSEVLSDRMGVMAKQMGHSDVLNQAIRDMLLYQRCIVFPRENWFVEQQYRAKGSRVEEKDIEPDTMENPLAVNGSGKPKTKPSEKLEDDILSDCEIYTDKEGIRYFIPHPTRVYYDQAFSPKTLNHDNGCTFVGHWKVVRWREIGYNPNFYNLDRVNFGSDAWWDNNGDYVNALLNTSVMSFPSVSGEKISGTDRQEHLATGQYYNSTYDDNAVMVYEHFEKIVPKDEGLGDYDQPIWARFVLAGDGTIVFATPVGFTPAATFQDNGDDNKTEEAGFGMDMAPFQDQVTNLFTQYLLSVKQNLANMTLVDKNVIPKDWIAKVTNMGENFFRRLNIFPFDSVKLKKAMHNVPQAIYSHRFQQLDTNSILQAIRTTLDLAERVLGYSAQEIAQAASHEQTKAEVQVIASSTNNILAYTGFAVDQGMEAMGRMNYEADMNYGDKEFTARISTDLVDKLPAKRLEELGIVVIGKKSKDPKVKTLVRARRVPAATLSMFACIPAVHERNFDGQAAVAMGQWMRHVASNQMMANAIGPDQFITILNEIARLAGLPLPAPLVNKSSEAQGDQQQQEMLQQVVAKAIDESQKGVKAGLQPVLQATMANKLLIEQLYKMLGKPMPDVTNSNNRTGQAADPRGGSMVATT